MIIKGTQIRGLTVINIADNRKIDEVNDIIYDPASHSIKAFLTSGYGIFSDPKVILFQDIKGLDMNGLYIDSPRVVKNISDTGEQISQIAKEDTYLTKSKIMTQGNDTLGVIHDIVFDAESGQVQGFEVDKNGFATKGGKKYVPIQNIVSLNKDVTVVAGYSDGKYEDAMRVQPEDPVVVPAPIPAPRKEEAKPEEHSFKDRLQSFTSRFTQGFQKPSQQTHSEPQASVEHPEPAIAPMPAPVPVQIQTEQQVAQPHDEKPEVHHEPMQEHTDDAHVTVEKPAKQNDKPEVSAIDSTHTISAMSQDELQSYIEDLRKQAQEVQRIVDEKIREATESAKLQQQSVHVEVDDKRRRDVVGQYLTKNILLPNDEFLAKRGDLVTNKLLVEAEKHSVVDQVLDNASYEPSQYDTRYTPYQDMSRTRSIPANKIYRTEINEGPSEEQKKS